MGFPLLCVTLVEVLRNGIKAEHRLRREVHFFLYYRLKTVYKLKKN